MTGTNCALAALVLLSVPLGAFAQDTNQSSQPASQRAGEFGKRPTRTLDYWATQLTNDRYLRRQSAQRHLIEGGQQSVPILKSLLTEADLETVDTVIMMLAKIGESEKPWETGGAISALEDIAANHIGTRATLAQSALKSFAQQRGNDARLHLSDAGVKVGIESVALGSRSRPRSIVRIGKQWNGDLEALSWLRWISDVDFAIVEGTAIRKDVIEAVVRMPQFATLVLIDGEIDAPIVEILEEQARMDAIEFRYVPLNEALLKKITKIRIRNSLYLLGTDISKQRVERLRVELPGVEIERRQGGFLGVNCRTTLQDSCEISDVIPDSGAYDAGLRAGDIIIRINDAKITRFEDLQQQVHLHSAGEVLSIRYRRNGQTIDTRATLKKQRDR